MSEITPGSTISTVEDEPAQVPLISAYAPRWLVIALTIVAIVTLIIILIFGAYWSQRFQNAVSKFFVCVLLAFCFAIIMFVIYPQNVRVKNIPLINLPVELVGPPALFVITLPLLLYIYRRFKL